MNLSKLTTGFKWYMEIKVINLMSYFFSINVILWYENEIIVHLPLRGCPINMLFFNEYNGQ